MRLIAITPVRNESWILQFSARATLTWCDEIVFLDHASNDDTGNIIDELDLAYPGRVHLIRIKDPAWNEMNHRQLLLEAARGRGASHIAIVDADEILSANFREQVRRLTQMLAPGCLLHVPLHNLWRSLDAYRNDARSYYGCTWASITFRDSFDLNWRPTEDGYQHHSREPANAMKGLRLPRTESIDNLLKMSDYGIVPRGAKHNPVTRFYLSLRDEGGLMHLQHASWRRLKAKQALYQMIEMTRWPHHNRDGVRELYASALDENGAIFKPVPQSWWDYDLPRSLIRLNEDPWQEAEVRRLLTKYGRDAFYGLDLFGVA